MVNPNELRVLLGFGGVEGDEMNSVEQPAVAWVLMDVFRQRKGPRWAPFSRLLQWRHSAAARCATAIHAFKAGTISDEHHRLTRHTRITGKALLLGYLHGARAGISIDAGHDVHGRATHGFH